MELEKLYHDLNRLTLFRSVLAHPTMVRLLDLLSQEESATDPSQAGRIETAYADFLAHLYETDTDIGRFVLNLLLEDENPYVLQQAAGKQPSPILEGALLRDLESLEQLAAMDSKGLKGALGLSSARWSGPDWTWGRLNITDEYYKFIKKLPTQGYGMWAKYNAFTLRFHPGCDPSKEVKEWIAPIAHPDAPKLSRLFGYQRERDLIFMNMEALLTGGSCQNMLLYGDAGTGKSSTIKAFANGYAPRGLRIIQVSKHQLFLLPQLMEALSSNPLKFILFIDDLSFSAVDDSFIGLKTVLEGGLMAQSPNVVIFATTNRRHLVTESHGDRTGDELHINDGLQETMGLAGRFGLTVVFQRPSKSEYLMIVESLAKEKSINMPSSELIQLAEAYAIRSNGRSPRVAQQFIHSILSQGFPLPPGRS